MKNPAPRRGQRRTTCTTTTTPPRSFTSLKAKTGSTWNEGAKQPDGTRKGGMRDWLINSQNKKEGANHGSWDAGSRACSARKLRPPRHHLHVRPDARGLLPPPAAVQARQRRPSHQDHRLIWLEITSRKRKRRIPVRRFRFRLVIHAKARRSCQRHTLLRRFPCEFTSLFVRWQRPCARSVLTTFSTLLRL